MRALELLRVYCGDIGVRCEAKSRDCDELKLFDGKTGRGRSKMMDLGPGPSYHERTWALKRSKSRKWEDSQSELGLCSKRARLKLRS